MTLPDNNGFENFLNNVSVDIIPLYLLLIEQEWPENIKRSALEY